MTPSSSSSTSLWASTSSTQYTFNPIFDFTDDTPLPSSVDDNDDSSSSSTSIKQKSLSSFERIDDAIMGGISLSALKDVPQQNYASWSGICRTDGGGFCGMRTRPFQSPLNATGAEGIYVDCRLASDDEPERRVWKMTVRTDTSRGEMVFQSQFDLKGAMEYKKKELGGENEEEEGQWARVLVPFDGFQLVRGPRLVVDGPKLDVTNGIFQIGMTMSKFLMAVNTTELENFRPGFFDLHIQRIGFYQERRGLESQEKTMQDQVETVRGVNVVVVPETLTKMEADKKKPLLLKILAPVAKLLFSEKANRRKSAMNLLREKRNMSRMRAILFGIQSRRKSMGLIPSIFKTVGILGVDSARSIFKEVFKVIFVYPLRFVRKIVFTIQKTLGVKGAKKPPTLKE
jgi:Complex I intermediate-associated protein 30 (CIA30).